MHFDHYTLTRQAGYKHPRDRATLLRRYEAAIPRLRNAFRAAVGAEQRATKMHDCHLIDTEYFWIQARRPFYHIYPLIVEALERTRMDLTLAQLPLCDGIAICFDSAHRPQCDGLGVKAMLWMHKRAKEQEHGRDIDTPVARAVLLHDDPAETRTVLYVNGTSVIDDRNTYTADDIRFFGIAAGVTMLADDERFVEPLLLQRDRARQLTPEQYRAAVDRAEREHGGKGFVVGAHIRADISPHVRRPHFAIRWKGKGEPKTPVLVPVRMSVVNRAKIYPIPTGHEDPPEKESP